MLIISIMYIEAEIVIDRDSFFRVNLNFRRKKISKYKQLTNFHFLQHFYLFHFIYAAIKPPV